MQKWNWKLQQKYHPATFTNSNPCASCAKTWLVTWQEGREVAKLSIHAEQQWRKSTMAYEYSTWKLSFSFERNLVLRINSVLPVCSYASRQERHQHGRYVLGKDYKDWEHLFSSHGNMWNVPYAAHSLAEIDALLPVSSTSQWWHEALKLCRLILSFLHISHWSRFAVFSCCYVWAKLTGYWL